MKKSAVKKNGVMWVTVKKDVRNWSESLNNDELCFFCVLLLSCPVSDSLYIPLVSILNTSPYISQRVHFPVLNFVTYNFMYVFCLQLFQIF
jgi:hypothetical protein